MHEHLTGNVIFVMNMPHGNLMGMNTVINMQAIRWLMIFTILMANKRKAA